jgi:hypothetical protein
MIPVDLSLETPLTTESFDVNQATAISLPGLISTLVRSRTLSASSIYKPDFN